MAMVARRIAILFLLAAHLLTVTAGRFHRHGSVGPGYRANCSSCSVKPRIGLPAACQGLASSNTSTPLVRLIDKSCESDAEHDCAICYFLSQKVTSPKAFEIARVEPLRQQAPQAPPARAIPAFSRIERCRAPPSIA
jgi:hypothetical protein